MTQVYTAQRQSSDSVCRIQSYQLFGKCRKYFKN